MAREDAETAATPKGGAVEDLVRRMVAGDRVALARLLTKVENRDPETAAILAAIHDRCGRAYTLGVTGPPGAGKSTLVSRVVERLRAREKKVGVLAIDPSSPFSGGSVLGDRIRMQPHFLDPSVFIRSVSTRGSHGGLARATRHMGRLLDASGKDYIVVETVGVGQTELDIMRLADTTIVVLVPEAGDTIQAMKAGLLEIADIFVVNKADREGALRIKGDLEAMLQLRPPAPWEIPVLLTQAERGDGVEELMATVERHREFLSHSGVRGARVAAARREEFLQVLREEIAHRLEVAIAAGAFEEILRGVERGDLEAFSAAVQVLDSGEAADSVTRVESKSSSKSRAGRRG